MQNTWRPRDGQWLLEETLNRTRNNSNNKQIELHQMKKFCTANRMKTQVTEWEKGFASYFSNEGLISGIHK